MPPKSQSASTPAGSLSALSDLMKSKGWATNGGAYIYPDGEPVHITIIAPKAPFPTSFEALVKRSLVANGKMGIHITVNGHNYGYDIITDYPRYKALFAHVTDNGLVGMIDEKRSEIVDIVGPIS